VASSPLARRAAHGPGRHAVRDPRSLGPGRKSGGRRRLSETSRPGRLWPSGPCPATRGLPLGGCDEDPSREGGIVREEGEPGNHAGARQPEYLDVGAAARPGAGDDFSDAVSIEIADRHANAPPNSGISARKPVNSLT
jgi:hypothetical protein